MVLARALGIVGAVVCAAVFASCAESEPIPDRPPAKSYTVRMEGMVFQPRNLTVTAGDTIVWVNNDLVPHGAASETAGFDSKVVQANQSWQTRIDRAGDFDYVCPFHPTMTATLHVLR